MSKQLPPNCPLQCLTRALDIMGAPYAQRAAPFDYAPAGAAFAVVLRETVTPARVRLTYWFDANGFYIGGVDGEF